MNRLKKILVVFVFVVSMGSAWGMDYVRLRSGQVVEGAILRQDTSVIILTEWDQRQLVQPPLTVYTRNEVESIWFSDPRVISARHIQYDPRTGSLEIGGSALFQTWAETGLVRRHLVQVGAQGGYAVTRALALDLSLDVTIPLGSEDPAWQRFEPAYELSVSVVAQPFRWHAFVPYGLAGGGTALATPINGLVLTNSQTARNMINAGLGVKWGLDHLGARLEWRHHFYTWSTIPFDAEGNPLPDYSADASVVRAGLFYFR